VEAQAERPAPPSLTAAPTGTKVRVLLPGQTDRKATGSYCPDSRLNSRKSELLRNQPYIRRRFVYLRPGRSNPDSIKTGLASNRGFRGHSGLTCIARRWDMDAVCVRSGTRQSSDKAPMVIGILASSAATGSGGAQHQSVRETVTAVAPGPRGFAALLDPDRTESQTGRERKFVDQKRGNSVQP